MIRKAFGLLISERFGVRGLTYEIDRFRPLSAHLTFRTRGWLMPYFISRYRFQTALIFEHKDAHNVNWPMQFSRRERFTTLKNLRFAFMGDGCANYRRVPGVKRHFPMSARMTRRQ